MSANKAIFLFLSISIAAFVGMASDAKTVGSVILGGALAAPIIYMVAVFIKEDFGP